MSSENNSNHKAIQSVFDKNTFSFKSFNVDCNRMGNVLKM